MVVTPVAMIDSDANGSLLEIGFSVRFAGGEAKHGHHRDFVVYNNADIRYALIGVGLEKLQKLQSFLKKSNVGHAGQRENCRREYF